MYRYFFIALVFLSQYAFAQSKVTGAGSYPIDTTQCRLCYPLDSARQYYSLRIKYPLSSEALADKARKAIQFPQGFSGTGFITVRFLVNCGGETGCFHIYQVDKDYRTTDFGEKATGAVLDFVKSMGTWPLGVSHNVPYDYFTYLTFRIVNGHVTQVVP